MDVLEVLGSGASVVSAENQREIWMYRLNVPTRRHLRLRGIMSLTSSGNKV